MRGFGKKAKPESQADLGAQPAREDKSNIDSGFGTSQRLSARLGGDVKKGDVILEVRDLSVKFWVGKSWFTAAENLNYELRAGETLAIVGESGMGALTYHPAWDVKQDAVLSDLDDLSAKCQAILNHEDVSDLDELFRMGGSSGGARPKVMTDEWIIKFPASGDMKDSGLMEKEYMDCAADCGIIVPETKLMPSKQCRGYFAVRRFDRDIVGERTVRRHMLTAAAILEVDWRTAALDYHTLMKLTKILSLGNEADLEQMYRRMCFNVFAHNRDDHAKNFSWIYDERMDCWHPSPAYDLTWSTTYFGEHTTTVDGNGKDPGIKEVVAVGKTAGMMQKKCRIIAEEIFEQIQNALGKYQNTLL